MASKNTPSSPTSTSTSTRAPRRDDRQAQLLEIACRLFARYGYKGTSLRDIADIAKITKAALYYHFPNKNSLYERIVLQGLKALVEEVETKTAQTKTAHEKLRVFMLTSAEIYERNPDQWVAGSNAFWVDEDTVPRKAAIDLRDRYEAILRECILEGMQSGEFKNVDPVITGRVVLSMVNGLARWFHPGGKLSIHQVIDQYLELVLRGIETPQPTKKTKSKG